MAAAPPGAGQGACQLAVQELGHASPLSARASPRPGSTPQWSTSPMTARPTARTRAGAVAHGLAHLES